ncbi:MAG: hypothetical protein ACJ754_10120 [Pyrinomonadaceae bacterium]
MPNNSLEIQPPPGQVATADSSLPPLSYSRRRFIQAAADTREKLKQDIQMSGLAGILTAITVGVIYGFTWTTILGSAGAFLAVLLIFFLYYYIFTAPEKLDKERQDERDSAHAQLEGAKLLAEGGDKPKFKGKFRQVYFEDFDLEDDDFCFFVIVQLSLTNVHKTAATIEACRLRVHANTGRGDDIRVADYDGMQAPLNGYVYSEGGTRATGFADVRVALNSLELPQKPHPDGYRQGITESEKWLRFKVGGFTADDMLFHPDAWRSRILLILLFVTDSFGVEHLAAFGEPPWTTKGKVEFDYQSLSALNKEELIDMLTIYSDDGRGLYEECMRGSAPQEIDARMKEWETKVATVLESYLDAAHRAIFTNAPLDSAPLPNRSTRDNHLISLITIRLQKLNQIIEEQRGR